MGNIVNTNHMGKLRPNSRQQQCAQKIFDRLSEKFEQKNGQYFGLVKIQATIKGIGRSAKKAIENCQVKDCPDCSVRLEKSLSVSDALNEFANTSLNFYIKCGESLDFGSLSESVDMPHFGGYKDAYLEIRKLEILAEIAVEKVNSLVADNAIKGLNANYVNETIKECHIGHGWVLSFYTKSLREASDQRS